MPEKEDSTAGTPDIKPGTSTTSIMSGHSDRQRADAHGNRIHKGGNQRCSFRDEQGEESVQDVKEVTAYKTSHFTGTYDEEKQSCGCIIM
mmetsp:Transcript_13013/g.39108  ORF Transcript_13013/g.39108 Transcript_13013/m.39108 type:complete len:90 (-) Transcript_13013:26-295(-)